MDELAIWFFALFWTFSEGESGWVIMNFLFSSKFCGSDFLKFEFSSSALLSCWVGWSVIILFELPFSSFTRLWSLLNCYSLYILVSFFDYIDYLTSGEITGDSIGISPIDGEIVSWIVDWFSVLVFEGDNSLVPSSWTFTGDDSFTFVLM